MNNLYSNLKHEVIMQAATTLEPPKALPPASQPPTFLKQNWRTVLSTDCPDIFKYVRVVRNVATITNGKIVLRCPVNYPNGFYYIGEREDLICTTSPSYFTYPDIETLEPPLKTMKPFCQLTREVVGPMISFLESVRKLDGYIVFDKTGMMMRQDSRQYFQYPFNLEGGEMLLSAFYLKLALIEMLRYDYVVLSN
ncbi:MAG: hypothetical protein NTW30_04785 [Candidatus Aenigmarchaeota archaeon]|nr:hypothetical protein [Candidatus Aenigmarchaeota archaeon]